MSRYETNKKLLVLSAYRVEFTDVREGCPQKVQEETVVFHETDLAVLDAMGMNRLNYIENRYTRAGYRVVQITKQPRREAVVDLSALYADASAAIAAADQARRVADLEELAANQARQLEALALDQAAEQGAQQV